MGFWDKVKKKANAVVSGADFWDKEENRVQRNNYATGRRDVYVPPSAARNPQGAPVKPAQTFFDKVRDVADANSPMDIYRREQAQAPKMYAEQQKQNGIGRVANNPWQRTTNTVRALGEGLMESPKAVGEGLAYAFSPDVKAAETALQRNADDTNRLLLKTQQELKDPYMDPAKRARKEKLYSYLQKEAGNSFKAYDDFNKKKIEATDPKRMAAATADLAFTVATAGVGTAGVQGVKTAFKEGAKAGAKNAVKQASKELAKQSAKTAAVSAPSGAFGTMAVNPEASTADVLKGAAIGGAVGAALPVAGLIAAPVAKAAGRGVVKVTRAGANKTLDAADTVKYKATTTQEMRDIADSINRYKRAYDVESDPVRKRQISRGITDLNAQYRRARNSEDISGKKTYNSLTKEWIPQPTGRKGGYLAGKQATTFDKQKVDGKVFDGIGGERFEGSDEGIKIKGLGDTTSRDTTVGELIDHPKFFEDYPHLKDIPIHISRNMEPNEYGGFNPKTGTMELNRNLSVKQKLNTLMHELNHAVDAHEGFKGGGNPYHPKLDQIVKDRMAKEGRNPAKIASLRNKLATADRQFATAKTATARKAAKEKAQKLAQELRDEQNKKTENDIRFEAYEDLGGETGSRTVGNRVGMSDKDRAKRPFMADLDTSDPRKIIITKDDGSQFGNAVEEDLTPLIPKVGKDAPTSRKEWVHPTVQVGAPLPGGRKVTVGRPRKAPRPNQVTETFPTAPAQQFDAVKVENGLMTQAGKAFIDKDAALIKVLKRMEKASGKTGLVERFYYDSGLQSRANSIANNKMATSAELQQAMQGLNRQQLKDFNTYAGARAELTMAKKGMKTSRPQEKLQEIVDELGEEYSPRFEHLNKFYKERAKDLFDAGIIDRVKYNDFIKSDDYVRIQRDFDDLAGRAGNSGNSYSFGKSVTSFRRKGSERELLPEDQVTFEYTQQIQKEIQRNQTATNLIDTLAEFGMTRRLTTKEAVNKNTVKRIVNGKTEIYEVDPVLKEVIDNLRPYSLNGLERIIGAPARLFRAGTTALSAPFSYANYIRDQAGSALNSQDIMATHIRHPGNMVSGLHEAAKDFGLGQSNDPMWQKFIAHAGDTTQYDLTRNVRDTRMLSRELRGGQKGRAANATLHPIRTLEDFNSITEKATRFQNFKGIYQKTLAETGDEDMALQRATVAAWQNSVDFNRAGVVGRFANLLIPYFNAGIQGTRQMGKSFTRSPKSAVATTAKAIGIVGMPLYAATTWNMMDEERREMYNNLNDYEKENNIIFILPKIAGITEGTKQNEQGGYNVLKIPMPPGFKELVEPGRRAIESFANKEPNDFGAIAGDLLQAVAGPVQVGSPGQTLASLIPQAVKPSVQQSANKDFFTNKEVVQDHINEATDEYGNPIPEHLKATDYTSGSARLVGNLINQSPIRVEKFFKDTFGSVGQYGVNTADQLLAGNIPVVTSATKRLGIGGEDGIGSGLNVIPEDQIGGKNALTDISGRFFGATGKVNENASDGTKYFIDVKEVTKNKPKPTLDRWEAIHPSKTNFLGEEINQKSIVDAGVRAGIYLQDPKVFEMDKELDARAQKRGNPGNPLFKLTPEQRQTVLSLQANKNFNPGDKAMPDVIEKQNPWIKDYYEAQSKFYDTVKANRDRQNAEKKKRGEKVTDTATENDPNGIPKPESNDEIDRLFKVAEEITDKKLKSDFYKQNPKLTEYLAQNEQYNRAKRAYLGLPQLDRFPEDPGMKALEEQFFTITDKKAKRAFIEANPGLSDYWLKKNLYQLNEAGARARFEGEELDEDAAKDIMSIAKKLNEAGGGGGYGGGSGGGSGGGGGRSYDIGNRVDAPTMRSAALKGNVRVTRNKSTPGKILVKRGGRI